MKFDDLLVVARYKIDTGMQIRVPDAFRMIMHQERARACARARQSIRIENERAHVQRAGRRGHFKSGGGTVLAALVLRSAAVCLEAVAVGSAVY